MFQTSIPGLWRRRCAAGESASWRVLVVPTRSDSQRHRISKFIPMPKIFWVMCGLSWIITTKLVQMSPLNSFDIQGIRASSKGERIQPKLRKKTAWISDRISLMVSEASTEVHQNSQNLRTSFHPRLAARGEAICLDPIPGVLHGCACQWSWSSGGLWQENGPLQTAGFQVLVLCTSS